MLRALLRLQEEGGIVIVRTKNRFTSPTPAGWADAMLNIICMAPAESQGAVAAEDHTGAPLAHGHVCELQLIHATMLKARKEFGGHNAYAAFREAAELLEFIVDGLLPPSLEGPSKAGPTQH